MSLSAALNSALRGLQASQVALAVSSGNISNAQTPGYTRQRAILAAAPTTGDRLRLGGGVQVLGTEAIRELFVEIRMQQETSSQAQQQTMSRSLSDIESFFNDSETTGMLASLSAFFNSFHALAAEPSSVIARQEVISRASQLAKFLNTRSGDLGATQIRVDQAMKEDVTKANGIIDKIALVSQRISEEEPLNPAHELRDQRSVLVKQLAEILNVHELESNGEYQLTTANNQLLVYNGTGVHLQPVVGGNGLTTIQLGSDDITADISGGSLAGKRDIRDGNIPAYLAELDQLAYVVAQEVNSLHSAGYALDGSTGNNFFTPLATVTGAARTISVDPAVVADPRKVATSRQANGTGNEVANDIANLIDQQIFSAGTVIDHYRNLVYTIGSDASDASLGSSQHEALLNQLENRRQEVSGVSIDEESLLILRFQRAFEASARVVRTVNDLLELTMSLGQ